MTTTLERIDGVVIGALVGFEGEVPLVVFAGNPREAAIPARSLAPLDFARSARRWPCCSRMAIRRGR